MTFFWSLTTYYQCNSKLIIIYSYGHNQFPSPVSHYREASSQLHPFVAHLKLLWFPAWRIINNHILAINVALDWWPIANHLPIGS